LFGQKKRDVRIFFKVKSSNGGDSPPLVFSFAWAGIVVGFQIFCEKSIGSNLAELSTASPLTVSGDVGMLLSLLISKPCDFPARSKP